MPKRIVVLTSFMHQRGGDLISATSFMKAVFAQDSDVEIDWIVKRDLSGFKKNIEAFKMAELGEWQDKVHLTCIDSGDYKNVTIIGDQMFDQQHHHALTTQEITERSENNWGNLFIGWNGWKDVHEILKSPAVSSQLRECDMIVVNANPHRMVEQDYRLLATFNKPTRLIPEYDLEHNGTTTYDNPNVEVIHTGFGGSNEYSSYKNYKGLGVYIDDSALATNHLDDVAEADAEFIHHVTQGDLARYKHSHALFYGYFFDLPQHVLRHYVVNTGSYIQNSIMLAMDIGDKNNIDIVIPGHKDPEFLQHIYQKALDTLPETYKSKINTARYDLKQKTGIAETIVAMDDGPFNVRLLNPQHLGRKTVQALLNDSEPWVGLTGDASWIEGLMKGKIVCYQVVRWKEFFFRGFLNYLKNKLPHSPLTEFYQSQRNLDFTRMRALYQTSLPEMQADAKRLATLLMDEKNLATNMIPHLLRSLNGLSPQLGAVEEEFEINVLETFIDRIREHLEIIKVQKTLGFWSRPEQSASETLSSSLDFANNLEQVSTALIQYYQHISENKSGKFEKNKFEAFMLRIGILDSEQECEVLGTKLQQLCLSDLNHLMLQPISGLS